MIKYTYYKYFTDGAATLKKVGNEYKREAGGWSFIKVQDNDIILSENGGSPQTTNQEMELYAICAALREFLCSGDRDAIIEICSDSAYSINIYTQWAKNWQKNGWKRAKNQPIVNLPIIKETWKMIQEIEYQRNTEIVWTKVKGHSGNYYNEIADEYAVKGKEMARDTKMIIPYKDDKLLNH